MTGEQIREQLKNGQRVYGTHIASLMNPTAAAMAAEMEMDFAFICTEHMPIDRTEVAMMCRHYAARGVSPIVRVPSISPSEVCMATDAGAEGIVVPYVESESQVRELVGAVRYRPIKGKKLQQVISGECCLPAKTQAFVDHFNRQNYLIIGVESVEAIEQLDTLINIDGVDGVDGVFLGPHDITVSMDIPEEYDNPKFIEVIEDVCQRCHKANVGVGLHTMYLDMKRANLQRLLNAGMNLLINSADISLMKNTMNDHLRQLREMTGDGPWMPTHDVVGSSTQSCIAPAEVGP